MQTRDKLAKELEPLLAPFVSRMIRGAGVGISSTTTTPGTTVAPVLADYLRADGTTPLTGSLAVALGATLDGIDLSAFWQQYEAHTENAHAHHRAFEGLRDGREVQVNADADRRITIYGANGIVTEVVAGKLLVKHQYGDGLGLRENTLHLNTPGALSATSTNSPTGDHTHSVAASSDPGAATQLLKTTVAGALRLRDLAIGASGTGVRIYDTGTVARIESGRGSGSLFFHNFASIWINGWQFNASDGHASAIGNLAIEGTTPYVAVGLSSTNVDFDGGKTGLARLRSIWNGTTTTARPGINLWDSQAGADYAFVGAKDGEYTGIRGLRGGKWGLLMSNITGAVGINMGDTGTPDAMLKVLGDARVHGGAFRVTSDGNPNILHVSELGRVGIAGAADDAQFALKVHGPLYATYLVGKHAIQLDGTTLLAHFDGPGRHELNFTGNPAGHLGQQPVVAGGVIYRTGKFGSKAVQIAEATTNLCRNPSFEYATGWDYSQNTTGAVRTNRRSKYGEYAMQLTSVAAGAMGIGKVFASSLVVTPSTQYTVSYWMFQDSAASLLSYPYIVEWNSAGTGTASYASGSVLLTRGKWTRVVQTITTNAFTTRLDMRPMVNATAAGQVAFIDAVQIEAGASASPYCDGSLGPGHTWSNTSTPESGTSSRTTASVTYPAGQHIKGDTGTLALWVYRDGNTNTNYNHALFAYRATSPTDNVLTMQRQAAEDTFYLIVQDSTTKTIESITLERYRWYHIVVTWDKYTGAAHLYIDGSHYGTVAFTGFHPGGQLHLQRWDSYLGANHLVDDLVVLDHAIDADLVRSVYESNAPVFAETSTLEWRAGTLQTVWADENGLSAVTINGDPAFAVAAQSRAWGGFTLGMGDVLIGRGASYLRWDAQANGGVGLLTIAGNGAGITAINGSEITTGTVSAARIAAGSITADKLAVASLTDNMILNPSAEQGLAGWFVSGSVTTDSTYRTEGGSSFKVGAASATASLFGRVLPLVPGEKYTVRFKLNNPSGSGTAMVRMNQAAAYPVADYLTYQGDPNSAYFINYAAVPSSWTTYEYTYTVPSGVYWGSIEIQKGSTAGTGIYADEVEVRKQLGTVHIKDGAITALKITTVDLAAISANIGSAVIDKMLTIGTAGEIRQGTGGFAGEPGFATSTYTGFRLWRESSFGKIGGYNSGVVQWEARTDGRFQAGPVVIDATGMTASDSDQKTIVAGSGIIRQIPTGRTTSSSDYWRDVLDRTIAKMTINTSNSSGVFGTELLIATTNNYSSSTGTKGRSVTLLGGTAAVRAITGDKSGDGVLKPDRIELDAPVVKVIDLASWITPTLNSGWSTVSSPGFRYRVNALGNIEMEGLLRATSGAANTTAFTLPAGALPSMIMWHVCAVAEGGGGKRVQVETNGNVTPIESAGVGGGSWVDMSGVHYRVAA